MGESMLPKKFASLERFVDAWDLPDINSRYHQRLATPLEEMQQFNDAIVACAEEIKSYLDDKSFDEYTAADRRLARLMFSFSIVAQSVQIYKQPAVPDSGHRMFDAVNEPKM